MEFASTMPFIPIHVDYFENMGSLWNQRAILPLVNDAMINFEFHIRFKEVKVAWRASPWLTYWLSNLDSYLLLFKWRGSKNILDLWNTWQPLISKWRQIFPTYLKNPHKLFPWNHCTRKISRDQFIIMIYRIHYFENDFNHFYLSRRIPCILDIHLHPLIINTAYP